MHTHAHDGNTVAGGMDDGGGQRRSLWKGPAIATALLLLIPLLGNMFVDGWNWKFPGFVLVGTLLFAAGLTYELITRNVNALSYRAAVVVALAGGCILVWMNFVQMADGVNPAAAMYFLVPPIGIIAAALSRFRPAGMTRAVFATALAQALVLAIMLVRSPTPWVLNVWRGVGLNTFCLLMFSGSALLFRTARGKQIAVSSGAA